MSKFIREDGAYYSKAGVVWILSQLMDINDRLFNLRTGGKLLRNIDIKPVRLELVKVINDLWQQAEEIDNGDE